MECLWPCSAAYIFSVLNVLNPVFRFCSRIFIYGNRGLGGILSVGIILKIFQTVLRPRTAPRLSGRFYEG